MRRAGSLAEAASEYTIRTNLRDLVGEPNSLSNCWRKQTGPGHEFVIIGNSSLEVSVPPGWSARF